MSINITDNGEILVRAPKYVNKSDIEKFLIKHEKWIKNKLDSTKLKNEKLKNHRYTQESIKHIKKLARKKIESRLKNLSTLTGLKYKKFRLSNAKKRWGSCSNKKTISLNWRLFFVPDEILDYIIIHELIHLKHMNHSKIFWKEVGGYCPKYKTYRNWLKENDYILGIEPILNSTKD